MSDLIRRSDAIKAMEQRYQDILRIFKRKVKDGEKAIALDMIGCIKSLPSADRPQVIRVKSIMRKEDYESLADSIRQQAPTAIVIPHNAELVTTAGRPQGEWIEKNVDDVKITVCSNCDKEPTFTHYYGSCGNYSLSDFCPNCGADMRGKNDE